MMQQMIFNTRSPPPSGLVAQSVGQRRSILKGHEFDSCPGQISSFPTISVPNYCHACLAVQQKFGLSVVNGALESTLFMAREAVSLLHGKQMMLYLWKVLLVFLARQSTTGSLTSRAREQPTRNDAQVDVWMHCSVLKPLIDSSGQTNLFITLINIINKWKE